MLKSTLPLRSRQGRLLLRQNGDLETPGADSLWNNTGGDTAGSRGFCPFCPFWDLTSLAAGEQGTWGPLRRQPPHAGASAQVTSSPLA